MAPIAPDASSPATARAPRGISSCGRCTRPASPASRPPPSGRRPRAAGRIHRRGGALRPTRQQAAALGSSRLPSASGSRDPCAATRARAAVSGQDCVRCGVANARRRGAGVRPRPAFAHGAVYQAGGGWSVIATYHPSRQNTNTGRLTAAMLASGLRRRAAFAGRWRAPLTYFRFGR